MFPVPLNLQLESVRTNIGLAKLQITEKLEAIEGQVAALTEKRELSSTDKDVKELSDKVATLTAKVDALEEERNLWLRMVGDDVVHVYGRGWTTTFCGRRHSKWLPSQTHLNGSKKTFV